MKTVDDWGWSDWEINEKQQLLITFICMMTKDMWGIKTAWNSSLWLCRLSWYDDEDGDDDDGEDGEDDVIVLSMPRHKPARWFPLWFCTVSFTEGCMGAGGGVTVTQLISLSLSLLLLPPPPPPLFSPTGCHSPSDTIAVFLSLFVFFWILGIPSLNNCTCIHYLAWMNVKYIQLHFLQVDFVSNSLG